jgi:hypothetical protein
MQSECLKAGRRATEHAKAEGNPLRNKQQSVQLLLAPAGSIAKQLCSPEVMLRFNVTHHIWQRCAAHSNYICVHFAGSVKRS